MNKKILAFTLSGLVVYVAMTLLVGHLATPPGMRRWVFWGVLWLLGLILAAVVVWFLHRQKKGKEAIPGAPAVEATEVDLLVREAEGKLSAAHLGRISGLPIICVIGETGSTKTSTVVHSGLEPELLAGQVFQDNNVAPTLSANLWLAGRVVIAEFGGKLMADAGQRGRLVKRLQPGKLGSVMGQGGQAPRAALVCFDIETFTRGGSAEAAVNAGRNLRQKLGEISQSLGINLPVYALFTRSDRVPFFMEYVRNLSNDEAQQVVGASLPMPAGGRSGVWAEQEAARLGLSFDQLFRSLCGARPDFLSREHDAAQLPGIYEFPREFRKLRQPVVSFLVELCRPSQLAVGPFLRGFYFSGVRPVVVNEMVAAQASGPEPGAQDIPIDATRMLRLGDLARQRQAAAMAPQVVARKVPQWIFVPHLFQHVILQDRVAMGASGSSTKTNTLRRVLLIAAMVVCLVFTGGFIWSFVQNRGLESDVRQAALDISATESTALNLPSVDALQRLDKLRQTLQVLTFYNREGAPFGYRWFLYSGTELYQSAYKLYFARFKQLLFGQTQNMLLDDLRRLPPTPGPAYGPVYDTLKAYLITTSNHDKSTREFLPPVLLNRWSADRNIPAGLSPLAQKQFEFYSDELRVANPYANDNDAPAIDKGRRYLAQFAGFERVYQAMLINAAKGNPPINFNKKFPGSADVVLDNKDVAGPFTKAGWDFMRNAMHNPERYFAGEEWVLGPQGAANIDRANLQQQLQARYFKDFIGQWRAYLGAASVVKYKDLKDASEKLNVLSGNLSPLLALFCLASQHTNVDDPGVAAAFQPVQAVVPPTCADRYIAPPNQSYINSLVTLQTSIEAVAAQPQPDDAAAGASMNNATQARIAAKQVAQTFRIDAEGHVDSTVQTLMVEPITNAEALLRSVNPAELNAKGKGMCGQMRPVWAKYPFNPKATVEASVADVNGIFHKPEGALWTLYAALQKYLVLQGNEYVPNPKGGVTLNPAFVTFFNQAAAFSNTLYAGNTPDPHFTYALKPLPLEGITGYVIGVDIDGQSLSYSGAANAQPKQFTWQATGAHGLKSTFQIGGNALGWLSASGLWSVFHFFDQAESSSASESGLLLQWIMRTGKEAMTINGRPVTVRIQVNMGDAPPVFQKGFFARLGCVADVAKQ